MKSHRGCELFVAIEPWVDTHNGRFEKVFQPVRTVEDPVLSQRTRKDGSAPNHFAGSQAAVHVCLIPRYNSRR
jgi:hypothetical protein